MVPMFTDRKFPVVRHARLRICDDSLWLSVTFPYFVPFAAVEKHILALVFVPFRSVLFNVSVLVFSLVKSSLSRLVFSFISRKTEVGSNTGLSFLLEITPFNR